MLPNFDQLLDKYASLLVNKGLQITRDDYLSINADIEMAPLVRLITEHAYRAGAKQVQHKWQDDELNRLAYTYQSVETLTDIPDYRIEESLNNLAKRCKRLSLRSSNPNAYAGIDPDKISQASQALSHALRQERDATQANQVSWLVAAGAGQDWANLVFPDLPAGEALDALWDQIFQTTRVYEADPIAAWDAHEATLLDKAEYLNQMQFDYLHYTAPGTDLKLGLPKNHIWESAGSLNAQGEAFIANMPTEEVYTAPDANRVDGVVTSSKPLSYGGVIIDGMTFWFEGGRITKATAEQGEETLLKLIEANEGSRQLGEVALVPHESPISQSGITFFNTLFDENASNHLAIGQAYASSIVGGVNMTSEELAQAGLNRSNVHVDFMIGSEQMDIDGITTSGEVVPIFRGGAWAF